MTYHGVPNWPPVWTQTRKDNAKIVTGEVGVLDYVHANFRISGKCYLVIEHEGQRYVGTLIFESHTFCAQVCELLSHHLKKPIKEIGDLDSSHLL